MGHVNHAVDEQKKEHDSGCYLQKLWCYAKQKHRKACEPRDVASTPWVAIRANNDGSSSRYVKLYWTQLTLKVDDFLTIGTNYAIKAKARSMAKRLSFSLSQIH